MKWPIAYSLMSLGLYSLSSQALAWAFILEYSQPGASLAGAGTLTTAGALGLTLGQCINLRLLFAIGSHRLVALASFILILLFPLSALYLHFSTHMFARFVLGTIDGMIFLVIENALVLYSSPSFRASTLAAYLFTLYGMQIFSPFFASALLSHNSYVAIMLIFSALCAPCLFYLTHRFLSDQVPSTKIGLGEVQFLREGFLGAFLCALSGFLLPIWSAFIPSYLEAYPLHLTKIVTLFLVGGLAGQMLVIGLKKHYSSFSLTSFFLIFGALLAFTLLSPLAHHLEPLCGLLFFLAFTLYPLYGLGLDLALEQIAPSLWVRANKTLLSCYTIPAILSPILFLLIPGSPFISLPLVTGLALFFAAALLIGRRTHFFTGAERKKP